MKNIRIALKIKNIDLNLSDIPKLMELNPVFKIDNISGGNGLMTFVFIPKDKNGYSLEDVFFLGKNLQTLVSNPKNNVK